MDKIWWCQVSNAVQFITKTIDTVLNEKNLLLELPLSLPWYGTMKSQIEEGLRERYDRSCVTIQDTKMELEPGEIILNCMCKEEVRDEYRPSIGYATFLANCNNTCLNNCFVWITNIKEDRLDLWLDFVSDYTKNIGNGKKAGIFILETNEEKKISGKKGIQVISFNHEMKYSDFLVFNMLVSSSSKEKTEKRLYLAELASLIVGNDIELDSYCVCEERYQKFLENPYQTIHEIVNEEYRSDGNAFTFTLSEEEVKRLIWKAQIKIIFPIIEEFRERFITKYKAQIEPFLPIQNTFGEVYSEAIEVEIGTLHYMLCKNLISVTEQEKRTLTLIKDARNRLAHLLCLDIKEVEAIVNEQE